MLSQDCKAIRKPNHRKISSHKSQKIALQVSWSPQARIKHSKELRLYLSSMGQVFEVESGGNLSSLRTGSTPHGGFEVESGGNLPSLRTGSTPHGGAWVLAPVMWDLGPVPPVELTATQRYADHSSATMKLFLDAKASADTLLDLCVLHIKVNSKQQLYICYWSWNTNGVNWFQKLSQSLSEVMGLYT